MIYTLHCIRNGIAVEVITGTISELQQTFQHTITHAYNIQKNYGMRKITKNIPKTIHKFIQYLNDATFNVSGNTKHFILK